MTLLAALIVLLPTANPAPSADSLAVARGLVQRLGSPAYRDRELAAAQLRKLGGSALPALTEAAASATNPEVRSRVTALLPEAAAAQLNDRIAAFRADTTGNQSHDLPGWSELKTAAGNTADARRLYTELWDYPPTAALLRAAARNQTDLGRRLDARRAELYQTHVRFNGNTPRTPATPADLAGLLLLDRLAGPSPIRGYNPTWYLLQQTTTRELLIDDKRPAFRQLLVHWMDARTEPSDLYQLLQLAARLDRPEIPAGRYAAKLIESPRPGVPPFYRMTALTTLAKDGKSTLPTLAKALDDKSMVGVKAAANGQFLAYQIQVRDVALAMSIVVAGEKPENYGFENTNPAGGARAGYNQYRFTEDGKRDAAFKKWAERK